MKSATVTTTVLFTDLVGSTALLDKHGPEVADEIRRRFFTLLRAAIGEHGGTEVKNTGDGLMVVFPSATHATASAIEMQQAVARHNRRPDAVEIGMRVGVATGEATLEDDDYFGVPVVQAARLCNQADGGQILATQLVEMLSSPAGYEFDALGPFDLKGLSEPVSTYEALWASPSTSNIALPAALRLPEPNGFVGRVAERASLEQALERAAAGTGGIVLIGGEPGIGKTRLSWEFARAAHEEGATVLFGRCDERLGIPYQPFVEALTAYVPSCPVPELREQIGPLGSELARLVPSLGELVPGLPPPLVADAATELYRLLEAMVELLTAASHAAPVVFVIDDLHWARRPTLNMLQHIVRSITGTRVLVVATYRDSERAQQEGFAGWLADLHREPAVERVALSGFDEAEAVAFVEEAAGHPLAEPEQALARSVLAETSGNPFFLGQVLRHLVETGGVVLEGDHWRATISADSMTIPEGVRDLVGRRVDRLTDDGRSLLSIGSVIGPEFDLDVVQAATDLAEDDLLSAVEEAEAARLITAKSPNRYGFVHALVRTTMYQDLNAARRARLHRRVAQAIEARYAATVDDHALELSHHYFEAISLGVADSACRYSRLAADAAGAGLAFDEAASMYARALEALDASDASPDADRCDLLSLRGEALHRAGDPSWRDALRAATELARAMGDGPRFVRAVLAFSHWIHPSAVGGIDEELVGLLEESLELLDDGDDHVELRARLMALLAVELTFSPQADRRDDLSTGSLAMLDDIEDRGAWPRVLMSGLWVAMNNPFDLEAPIRVGNRLLEVSQERGDLEGIYYAHLMRYATDIAATDIERADEALATAIELAARLRQPAYVWNAELLRAAQTLAAGRVEEADALVNSTMMLGQDALLPETMALACYGGQLFWVRYDQGRLDELREILEGVVESQPGLPSWRAALALALCTSGHLDEARAHYEVAAAHDFQDAPRDFLWMNGKLIMADVLTRLGDAPRAHLLVDLLRPSSGRLGWNTLACTGPVDLRLGQLTTLLGEHDEADAYLGASAELCERVRAPVWGARTALARSDLAVARGDVAQATAHAQAALAAATATNAAGVVAEAESRLAAV